MTTYLSLRFRERKRQMHKEAAREIIINTKEKRKRKERV